MRLLIQRVSWARVRVAHTVIAEIGPGLAVFVGVGREDDELDARRCGTTVARLRIFSDSQGKMNVDVRGSRGMVLSVPQFTLFADTRRGNRPGFDQAAPAAPAEQFWLGFNAAVREQGIQVACGQFGAVMAVELCNDGPVTIAYDSRPAAGG